MEQDKDLELGGGIPVQVTAPVKPANRPIHPSDVPPINMDEDGVDDTVVAEIGLEPVVAESVPAIATVEEVSAEASAEPGPEPQVDDNDGTLPTGETQVETGSIWDECDELYQPPQNFANLQPVFTEEEPERGTDITLSPTNGRNLNILGDSKEIKTDEDFLYMIQAQNANLLVQPDDVRIKRISREGSDWMQNVPIEKRLEKGPDRIGFLVSAAKKAKSAGEEVTGQAAIDRFMQGTTLGSPITIPLVNTGIWVKMAPASAAYLSELDRTLAYARMQVGLDVNGLYGSSDDLIFRELINEAALKLITASNYVVSNPMDLREVIDDEDRATLAWGLAKVLYPKGIMVSIPCIDPNCGHVSTFRANPARMHVIDRSKLTPKQQEYLSRGIGRQMTLEDIQDYKAQFAIGNKSTVRIMNREFIFRSPTIAEKLQIGRSYLSTVNRAVDEAMASTPDDDTKRSNIMQQITSIEQVVRYAHYIAEIRIYNDADSDDNYSSITDEETIRNILRTLGNSPEMTEAVMNGIEEYLVDLGAANIVYPNTPCTKCKHADVPEKMKNKLLLPFDPETGFFILAQRKISLAGGNLLTDLSTFGVANLEQAVLEAQQTASFDRSIL